MSAEKEPQPTEKVVVITGAGSGIGAAVAVKFSKEEAKNNNLKLVLVDSKPESLVKTAQQCNAVAGLNKIEPIVTFAGDVSQSSVRKEILNSALSTFNRVDVLVNCAGILVPGTGLSGYTGNPNPTDNINEGDDIDKMLSVNVRAASDLIREFRQKLIENKGTVVNISSVGAFRPSLNRLYYCMSKAALDQVTRCLALELGRYGVRVNSVAPGIVRTGLHSSRDQCHATKEMGTDEYYSSQALKNPMLRNGTVEEIAEAVLFLASDKASFINGHVLVVDGGLSLVGPILD